MESFINLWRSDFGKGLTKVVIFMRNDIQICGQKERVESSEFSWTTLTKSSCITEFSSILKHPDPISQTKCLDATSLIQKIGKILQNYSVNWILKY